jgi:hypothetical protein
MKKLFVFAVLLIATATFAQDKMITKNGKITFEASVPAFEEVKAKNENVTCVLNSKTGDIASLALIKGFKFKLALMEEHFNENYMNSDTYPKSTFKGKILDFNVDALTATAKEYTMKGKLELHGKTNELTTTAKIRKTDAGIEIISTFNVNASDYDIEIPSVVKSKVSNKVAVKTEFILK